MVDKGTLIDTCTKFFGSDPEVREYRPDETYSGKMMIGAEFKYREDVRELYTFLTIFEDESFFVLVGDKHKRCAWTSGVGLVSRLEIDTEGEGLTLIADMYKGGDVTSVIFLEKNEETGFMTVTSGVSLEEEGIVGVL